MFWNSILHPSQGQCFSTFFKSQIHFTLAGALPQEHYKETPLKAAAPFVFIGIAAL